MQQIQDSQQSVNWLSAYFVCSYSILTTIQEKNIEDIFDVLSVGGFNSR